MTEAYDAWKALFDWMNTSEIYNCDPRNLNQHIGAKMYELVGQTECFMDNNNNLYIHGEARAIEFADILMRRFIDKRELQSYADDWHHVYIPADDLDEFEFEYGRKWEAYA